MNFEPLIRRCVMGGRPEVDCQDFQNGDVLRITMPGTEYVAYGMVSQATGAGILFAKAYCGHPSLDTAFYGYNCCAFQRISCGDVYNFVKKPEEIFCLAVVQDIALTAPASTVRCILEQLSHSKQVISFITKLFEKMQATDHDGSTLSGELAFWLEEKS